MMSKDTIYREDAINAILRNLNKEEYRSSWESGAVKVMKDTLEKMPTADRLKHYCVECKYEPIDKRCMPCSSCTNNPKNRDAFVLCEVEKKRSIR